MFHLCYLDESGCTGRLPSLDSQIQPVFALVGLIVPAARLMPMTREFMALKRRFNPGLFSGDAHGLDAILGEVKGGNLRGDLRSSSRNRQRRALEFLDRALDILETPPRVRMVGRVWIKPVGGEFKGNEIYTFSAQSIAENFHRFLADSQTRGVIVCDSRRPQSNIKVAHSVFTRKFRAAGDCFPRLLDSPFFADSQNHAGIQLADLLCSAILAPLAATVYLGNHAPLPEFAHPNYLQLRQRCGGRMQRMQYRFADDNGRWRGGLVVSDPGGRSGGFLFRG